MYELSLTLLDARIVNGKFISILFDEKEHLRLWQRDSL